MLPQRLRRKGTVLEIGLDRQHQVLHGRVGVAATYDLEGLHQRDARGHHGRQLAAEDNDIGTPDLASDTAEPGGRLFLDPDGTDTLTAKLRPHHGDVHRPSLAPDAHTAAIHPLPNENGWPGGLWLPRRSQCHKRRILRSPGRFLRDW